MGCRHWRSANAGDLPAWTTSLPRPGPSSARSRGSICRSTSPTSKRAGSLTRIDHPVNKDTELHPLVRLQFIGGIPEPERRAFLFTNVVDATGRKYDMPVVVGSIAASAEIYSLGMRAEVEDIGKRWMEAIARPIPPIRTNNARCQEVVITGDELRKPDGGLEAPAGAGLDARLRLRAVSQRHLLRHQGSRIPASRTPARIGRR